MNFLGAYLRRRERGIGDKSRGKDSKNVLIFSIFKPSSGIIIILQKLKEM